MSGRTLLTGGTVLVGPPRTGEFRRADVLVADGRIAAVGTDLPVADAAVVDATGTFVLPGFVDAHAHLWETTMRGIAADWDIVDFAWGIRYHHAAVHEPDDLYAGALAGALALLDAGTTTVLDHLHCVNSPDHADEALRAVTESGIRALWAYGFTEAPGGATAFGSVAERYADARRVRAAVGASGRVRFAVAAGDLLSVPWEQTVQEFTLARELGVPLTAHLDTTWGPQRLPEVELLARDGLLGEGQVFSHGNAMSEPELDALARVGAAVVSTPESELQMGLGLPVFARAAARGVRVGLGSDLQASNGPDMFTAMRLARHAENGRRHQLLLEEGGMAALRGVPVSTREVLHLATLGGAEALGLGAVTGSVELGKAADLVLLRHDSVRHRPLVDPFAAVVEHSGVADVDTVLVAGEVVKRSGSLPAGPRAAALVDAAWGRLAARMAEAGGPLPPRPDGLLEQAAAGMAANAPTWPAGR